MNLRAFRNSRNVGQILAIASLSSPHLNANPFLAIAAMCPVYRPNSPCGRVVSMASAAGLWESAGTSNQFCLMGRPDTPLRPNEILPMDPKEIIELLHTTARSLGAEVTSPWFYLQFGLILAGAGIAYASDAAIRSKVDMTSFAMGLPLPLRHFARVLVVQRFHRGVRHPDDRRPHHDVPLDLAEPQLSAGGCRQAGAGVAGHPPGDVGHSQRVHRQAGIAVGVADRGAQRRRPACNRPWNCWIRTRSRSCSAACG